MYHGFGFHRRKGMRFNSVLNALLSTVYTSNTITVRNVPAASAISIVGGTYSINGGGYTAVVGTISPGDTVNVRRSSSAGDTTTVGITLTIDTRDLAYNITTGDHVPTAFSFIDVNPALLSTIYISNPVIVAGTTIPSAISISGAGATYRINGGAFTAAVGTVNPGDVVEVRNTSSGSDTTAVNSTLSIGGGVIDTYTITTGDHVPTAFSFVDITNAALGTVYISAPITVAGITIPAAISITGAEYRVNGGSFTTSAGTVSNGDTVEVRVTSSGSNSTAVNGVVTIGGVSDTYTVTTSASGGGDTTPDAFVFTDVTTALLNTLYTSNTVNITGINSAAAISITGAAYSVNGGGYTSAPGTVVNNDTVSVQLISSTFDTTAVNAVLTVGGVSDTYTVTTGDSTPTAFSFTDITGAALSTVFISAPITVAGITIPTAISISGAGGDYRINGGAFTASPGTVSNGDTVEARVTSSGSNSTSVSTAVTIGGVSDTYTVTTLAGGGTFPDDNSGASEFPIIF